MKLPTWYSTYAPILDKFSCSPMFMDTDHVPTKYPSIAILGEAPSKDELTIELPLVGPSGIILEAALEFAGLTREQCYITNVFPFEAPDKYKWKVSEVDIASPYIRQKLRNFPIVVCLGKIALRVYDSSQDKIMEIAGSCFDIDNQKIIPSIHPSYVVKAFTSEQGGDESVFWYLVLALRNARMLLNGQNPYENTDNHQALLAIHPQQFEEWIAAAPEEKKIVVDFESTSTNPYLTKTPLCVGLSWNGIETITCAFKPWYPFSEFEFSDFLRIMERCTNELIMHNILYDYTVMRRFGYLGRAPKYDTMYLAHLAFEFMPKGLKYLSAFFCKMRPYSFSFDVLKAFYENMRYEENEYWLVQLLKYCGLDAKATSLLFNKLPEIVGNDWHRVITLHNEYVLPLLLSLEKTCKNGLILNEHIRSSIHNKLVDLKASAEKNAKAYLPSVDNLDSPDQISAALYSVFEENPGLSRKSKKGYSVDKTVLEKMIAKGFKVAEEISSYRKTAKLLSTYIDSYPLYRDPDNYIHTQFALAKTCRLRSSDPALQTLPRKSVVLELFTAEDGPFPYSSVLIKADYSAAEARLMGYFSNVMGWLDPTIDVHIAAASYFFNIPVSQVTPEMRQNTKSLSFGIIYGASPRRVALLIFGIVTDETVAKAKALLKKYFEIFPGIKEYMQNRENDVRNKGFVQMSTGLRRHFPLESILTKIINDDNRTFGQLAKNLVRQLFAKAVRESYNFFPQGGVAVLTNRSLIDLTNEFENMDWNGCRPSTINMQIHDALISRAFVESFAKTLEEMKSKMLKPIFGDVVIPVEFSIGWDLRNQFEIISAADSVKPIDWDNILYKIDSAAKGSEKKPPNQIAGTLVPFVQGALTYVK